MVKTAQVEDIGIHPSVRISSIDHGHVSGKLSKPVSFDA
jgi:hypothetical protein